MAGNAGKGREAGSRNRRTLALLELAEQGETPCAFALRIMRDESEPHPFRMEAARIAAPYVHSKPQPEPRFVSFDLPEQIADCADLLAVHTSLIRATANGEVAIEEAREVSALLETHRKVLETADLDQRIKRLEERQT